METFLPKKSNSTALPQQLVPLGTYAPDTTTPDIAHNKSTKQNVSLPYKFLNI